MKKLALLLVIISMVTVLITGCSGYSSNPPPGPSSNTTSVVISNFSFSPETITVKAGASVTWTNNDSTTHTVTSDIGAFDSGHLSPGATFNFTFASSGNFTYHCAIHPTMKGTVIVE